MNPNDVKRFQMIPYDPNESHIIPNGISYLSLPKFLSPNNENDGLGFHARVIFPITYIYCVMGGRGGMGVTQCIVR